MSTSTKAHPVLMRAGYLFACCSLASACIASGGDVETDDEEVVSQSEAIVNGTVSTAAETNGWIKLIHNNASLCSATLLRNDMVFTARHCATTDGTMDGPIDTAMANFKLTMGTQANLVPAAVFDYADLDLAVFQLKSFFSVGGKRFDFSRSIYTGTNASLLNQTLLCYGYGNSSYPGTGTAGTLRTANLKVTAADDLILTYSPNSTSQIQWRGDGGGSCLSGSAMTGLTFGFSVQDPPGVVTAAYQVGPAALRPWVVSQLLAQADAKVFTATTANISSNAMFIDHPDANGNPSALLQVTQNFNPPGQSGTYNNTNIGVIYQNGMWAVFNKNASNMPAKASFNVSVGGNSFLQTANSVNVSNNTTRLDNAAINANPNAQIVVTQVGSIANNRAVGVSYDARVSRWQIVNEDGGNMPLNVQFAVRVIGAGDAAIRHTSSAANTPLLTATYLTDTNLTGQPSAQFFVTHNMGSGATTFNHPIGVFYDGARSQWAVFTEDGAAIPAGTIFNVLIRP